MQTKKKMSSILVKSNQMRLQHKPEEKEYVENIISGNVKTKNHISPANKKMKSVSQTYTVYR